MEKTTFEQMLQAGVHFGHLKRKWNPHMAPYIFTEKKGIHIIDLHKTGVKLEEAAAAMKQIAKSGKKILFVATKKQAKEIVADRVKAVGMPYVTERWSGGMLTNFATIRKGVRKMSQIDKMEQDGTLNTMSKRERLQVSRQRAKLEKNLGSISDLTRIPSAIFIVDVVKENIALAEARKLGIPVFAMVDTNSDPRPVDFPIPANDDASRSIGLVLDVLVQAVAEGLQDRKADKDQADAQAAAKKAKAEAAKAAPEVSEEAAAEAPVAAEEVVAVEAKTEAKTEDKADEKKA
ncbi:MAG: 30S ribosomal protein S2 [Crocinitomicaceae bacterium]|jgi:small subunit ribosomal protein S2|nr:30S ribosomal protein S2 [Crocinitomicaceae bacterium]